MVHVKKLKIHLDDRGYLYEILRKDDNCFSEYGQAYISAINPGVVKGFHRHFKQTDHVCCVQGQIKLVTIEVDSRDAAGAIIKEFHLSPLDPKLIIIPPEVFHGWMCIGNEQALVLNISSVPFDPDNPDEQRVDPHTNLWGYKWEIKDK